MRIYRMYKTKISETLLGEKFKLVRYKFSEPREWKQLNWNKMFPPQTEELALERI